MAQTLQLIIGVELPASLTQLYRRTTAPDAWGRLTLLRGTKAKSRTPDVKPLLVCPGAGEPPHGGGCFPRGLGREKNRERERSTYKLWT